MVAVQRRFNRADDDNVRKALEGFGSWLDRIDGYIGSGVIGGRLPNAADFQLASSLRMALTVEDLRPAIESRPCERLAMRLVLDYRQPAAVSENGCTADPRPGLKILRRPEPWMRPPAA